MKIVKLYNNTRDRDHYFSVCGWNIRRQSSLQWVATDPEQQVRGEAYWVTDIAIEDVRFKIASEKRWVAFGPQHCPKGTVVQFGQLRHSDTIDDSGQPLDFEIDHLVRNGWRSWLAITTTKDTSSIWADSPGDHYVTINVEHITQVVCRGQGGLVAERSPYGLPYFSNSVVHERDCIERLKNSSNIYRHFDDLNHLVNIWVSRTLSINELVDMGRVERLILKQFRGQSIDRRFTTRQLKNLKRLALRNRNRLLANTHRLAGEEAARDQREFERDFDREYERDWNDIDFGVEEDFSLLDDRI